MSALKVCFYLVDKRKDWRTRIFTVLRTAGIPLCANKVARKLGWDRANDKLYKLLRQYVQDGQLQSPAPGYYMLPMIKQPPVG